MKFLWFKSDDGNHLEDSGIVIADSEADARDIVYNKYGYNVYSTFLFFENLDEELGYMPKDELCLSIFEMYEERK